MLPQPSPWTNHGLWFFANWAYNLDENLTLDDLLGQEITGLRLTGSFAKFPADSTSGHYFAHPESCYFAVARITKDQAEAYARRKAMPLAEVIRLPAPNLGYEEAK